MKFYLFFRLTFSLKIFKRKMFCILLNDLPKTSSLVYWSFLSKGRDLPLHIFFFLTDPSKSYNIVWCGSIFHCSCKFLIVFKGMLLLLLSAIGVAESKQSEANREYLDVKFRMKILSINCASKWIANRATH